MSSTISNPTEYRDSDPLNEPIVPPAEFLKAAEEPADTKPKTKWQTLKSRFPHGVNWGVALWLAGIHVAAIFAFFYFSWAGVITFFVLHFVTACLGVTLGYHRLLTHGSFKVPRVLEFFFSCCGIISGEGSPIFWVATHRKHHALSDQEGDPHSPLEGFWWAHFIWLQPAKSNEEVQQLLSRWAPDMWKDPMHRFLHYTYPIILIASGAALYALGEYVIGGVGLSVFLWGFCLRQVAVYHGTWFVNSATHVWGYRNYKTRDQSRNNWWVAFLSYGEGWHNNHHAYQRLARHGHRAWEIDITYAMIWTMKKLGLAKDVQDKVPSSKTSNAKAA